MITTKTPQANIRTALHRVAQQSGIDPRAVDMLLQALQWRQAQRQGGPAQMGPGAPAGLARGGTMREAGTNPEHRQLMRQLRQLLGPQFRPLLRNMLQNGQVQNALQQGRLGSGLPGTQPQDGSQHNVNRQNGLFNFNQQINIHPCGCGDKQINGDEKGGWLAKHGGYKKNKDGSFDITQGKWKGHKAVPAGNGKYNIVGPHGQPVGQYSSPKGKNKIASPLTFDLNGDGKVSTTGVRDGKAFDINGDGKLDRTAWAGQGDGVLAFDANRDGRAGSDGRELLGNNTDIDGDGRADGHANGFQALKALASKNLGEQAVADGKLDQWELQALERKVGLAMKVDGTDRRLGELGITEIDLGYHEAGKNADRQGNEHRQVGAGFVRNGQRAAVNDVWFKYQ